MLIPLVAILLSTTEAAPVTHTNNIGEETYWDPVVELRISCHHLCSAWEAECKTNCPLTWAKTFGHQHNSVKITCAKPCKTDKFCDDVIGLCQSCMELCQKGRNMETECMHNCPGKSFILNSDFNCMHVTNSL